jgi:hypothetical protein
MGAVREWTLAISAAGAVQGVWAFFFPASFYGDFPAPGADWVSTLGPFNDHLMRDFGSALVGVSVAGLVVAWRRSRDGIAGVLIGFVVFGSLHLGFHLTTSDEFTAASFAAQVAALLTFVVIPILLLSVMRRPQREGR